jgi:endonuclease/exonuclease/phosphatase (EEP) superfamily protein YafD
MATKLPDFIRTQGAVQTPRWNPPVLLWLDRLGGVGLVLVNLATLAGCFATAWWVLDLPTQFTVQFVLAQAIGLAYFLARHRRWPVLMTLPFMVINLVPVSRYYMPAAPATAMAAPSLRVMTLNLWAKNDRSDLVEKLVQAESPDVVLLVEATPRWHALLQGVRARYPYAVPVSDDWNLPSMLLSRWPVKDARVLPLGSRGKPTIVATICPPQTGDAAASCALVIGLHTDRPQSAEGAAARNSQLADLAGFIAQRPERRVIVMGDFNLTPWSPYFRRLLDDAGLHDSAIGRGVRPTWFSRLLPFGLPIDQVLLGPDVTVVDRHVGADVGSDHLPVIADLAF